MERQESQAFAVDAGRSLTCGSFGLAVRIINLLHRSELSQFQSLVISAKPEGSIVLRGKVFPRCEPKSRAPLSSGDTPQRPDAGRGRNSSSGSLRGRRFGTPLRSRGILVAANRRRLGSGAHHRLGRNIARGPAPFRPDRALGKLRDTTPAAARRVSRVVAAAGHSIVAPHGRRKRPTQCLSVAAWPARNRDSYAKSRQRNCESSSAASVVTVTVTKAASLPGSEA
jgi:hypothetical protein